MHRIVRGGEDLVDVLHAPLVRRLRPLLASLHGREPTVGMIHHRREPMTLEALARSSAIAVVRPAEPSYVFEEASTGPPSAPDRPGPPSVAYRLAYERFVVEEWVRAPLEGSLATIEVASPHNEAAVRDAHDRAAGMFGHTHPIVFEYVLDGPEGWRWGGEGRRIVFLSGTGRPGRFAHAYGGLSLDPSALAAVRAAAPRPAVAVRRRRWWLALPLVLVALFLAARSCGAPPPTPETVLAHYAGWDALIDAAWRKDRDRAAAIAVDLTGGPETDGVTGPAADGLATTSGALGFLGFAASAEELADGVAVAARGCGGCHQALDVPPPPRPVWAHETAATWAADAVVWARSGDPASGAPPLDVLADAWRDPVPIDPPHTDAELRAARVLSSCDGCHAP